MSEDKTTQPIPRSVEERLDDMEGLMRQLLRGQESLVRGQESITAEQREIKLAINEIYETISDRLVKHGTKIRDHEARLRAIENPGVEPAPEF